MDCYQFLLLTIALLEVKGLVLKQVFVLSRHNVRAPLTGHLESATPHVWPTFLTPTAHLTHKGAMLESHIAEVFAKWLKYEKLLQEPCPEKESVYILANAPQRTIQTARAFANSAFKDCKIPVHYMEGVTMDPVFNPIIRNASVEFNKVAKADMQKKLDGLQLNDAYTLLEEITDFKNSELCNNKSFCDFVNTKNEIVLEVGEEPNIVGPLSIGNSLVDVFLMSLYEGFPLKDIGWGKLNELHQWRLLSNITLQNQNVRFNSTNIAKDVAKPLLEYISNFFLKENETKLAVLFGHDSNLNSVIASLNIKYFELPDQFERTPIGGKLVFQKWYDDKLELYLLKINYLYQSTEQLRSGVALSEDNPPKSVVLQISNCDIVDGEYCTWENFTTILKSLY